MRLGVWHVRLGRVGDNEGALIYDGEALVAVLSCFSATHGDRAGRWLIECGFGLNIDAGTEFADLPSGCDWIQSRIDARGRG
jgi:hypothetical protein